MKRQIILILALLTATSLYVRAEANLVFTPKDLKSRFCASSKILETKNGKCLEVVPRMTGKPTYGVCSSVSLVGLKIKLPPGMYTALFKLDADEFVSHYYLGRGLYYGLTFPGGKRLMKNTFLEDVIPYDILKTDDIAKLPINSKLVTKTGLDLGELYYAHSLKPK